MNSIRRPLTELIRYEKDVLEILSQYPDKRDSARVEYLDLIQRLWNLRNSDANIHELSAIHVLINQLLEIDSAIVDNLTKLSRGIEVGIKNRIRDLTSVFAQNQALNFKAVTTYPPDLATSLTSDTDLINYITGVISSNVDFKYPGLLIGGELLDVVGLMVGCDPLYTCVNNAHVAGLRKCINNDFYFDNRLRQYNYDEFTVDSLNALPTAQFGFIMSLCHIDMMPSHGILTYLNKVKTLLRPGGTFVFSFYDIGIRDSLLDFERHYTNERNRIKVTHEIDMQWWRHLTLYPGCQELLTYSKLLETVGLRLVNYSRFNRHSVVVVKQSGDLTTVKALQASGEIKYQQG